MPEVCKARDIWIGRTVCKPVQAQLERVICDVHVGLMQSLFSYESTSLLEHELGRGDSSGEQGLRVVGSSRHAFISPTGNDWGVRWLAFESFLEAFPHG